MKMFCFTTEGQSTDFIITGRYLNFKGFGEAGELDTLFYKSLFRK